MNEALKAFPKAANQLARDFDRKAKRLRKKQRAFLNPYTGEVSAIACIMNPRGKFPKDFGK